MRISTATLYGSTLNAAMQAETSYAQANIQESTGLVSTTYGGLGSQAGQLLNLEAQLNQAQSYATTATQVSDRVQSMYTSIGDMITRMESLETTLSSAISSAASGETTASLNSAGQDALDTLAGYMNSQYGTSYVFSGADVQTAPVSLTGYTADVDTANTSYYQGDDTVASVQVSTQQSVSYGVTADNTAFEQALRAAYAASTVSISSTSSIEDVYSLAQSAVDSLSTLQSQVGLSASDLSDAADRQSSDVNFLTTTVGNIKSVDTAAIAAKVSEYQTQLSASFDAVAKVAKLTLSTYL